MKKSTKTISDVNDDNSMGKSLLFTAALLLTLPILTVILLLLFKLI